MRRAALLGLTALAVTGCSASHSQHGPGSPTNGSHPPTRGHRAGGIPSSLLAGLRPIGRGSRFQPPLGRRSAGACAAPLGQRREAHIELFAANRVVLLATGIGTGAPRQLRDGRLTAARCFGPLVTLDPTGTVYFTPGRRFTVADLFRAWGQPLSRTRLASFTGGRVRVYVDGRAVAKPPDGVALKPDAEIVLEVGPYVPPHTHFSFPSRPPPALS